MNIAKLRHTFMRSRTPTGAEMKQQNSLEVPPQIRSASFDEMQLKPGRRESSSSSSSPAERQSFLLRVPYLGPKRSKSFDSGCGDVDDSFASSRKRSSRPSSLDKASQQCVHCVYLEELSRRCDCDGRRIPYNMSLDFVTLSPNSPSSASPTQEEVSLPASTASSPRNKTASPKLERQPAIFHMNTSTELSSQENSFDLSDGGYSHHGSFLYLGSSSEYGTGSRRGARAGAGAAAEGQGAGRSSSEGAGRRAACRRGGTARRSLDISFASFPKPEELLKSSTTGLTRSVSLEPPKALRSKSIDIELPTEEDGDYKVVVTSPKAQKYVACMRSSRSTPLFLPPSLSWLLLLLSFRFVCHSLVISPSKCKESIFSNQLLFWE
ncbi:Eye-specific diacylglycerol kinase [Penaeus vannamei]|uniref:Eye-specific diacylglycerol kinase n=1 Tax=Penaeus vannamei TaxID=6689 RepID=A0A3R7LWH0_PENVA|nr:Eye-specific diacylglycerol kinase [Penaeus vannamei]